MRLALLAATVALAGCVGGEKAGYRDPSVPIASLAVYDPARMAGDWNVAAAFGAEAACGSAKERWIQVAAATFRVEGVACAGHRQRASSTEARHVGPGRFLRRGSGGSEQIWVLWADADNRIAVLGTPDGRFGRILARPGASRGDLMQAARRVLEFNGYDLARLVTLAPE